MRWLSRRCSGFDRPVSSVAAKRPGNGGGPVDQIVPPRRVIDDFWRPTVHGGGFARHHRKGLLVLPMDQIPRMGIADGMAPPGGRPNQAEYPVWTQEKAGIAHQLVLTHHRLEK